MKNLILILVAFWMSGCCLIKHEANPLKEPTSVNNIVIIKDETTREGYLDAVKDWLTRNDYKFKVVEAGKVKRSEEEWIMNYVGVWRWDMSIFLSKSEIKMFNKGKEVGNATYSVVGDQWSLNLSKWRSAEKTIHRMLDELFNKPKKIKIR